MLSAKRIELMTDLALFEQGKGREQLKTASYFKGDYVGLHLIPTIIWIIFGYFLILALYAVVQFNELLDHLTIEKLIQLGIRAGIGLAVILLVYIIVGWRYYAKKHKAAVRNVKVYYSKLRRLDRLYKQENRNMALERTLVDWEETER